MPGGHLFHGTHSLLQLSVLFLAYGLQPLVGGLLAGNLKGQVGEPAVRSRAVPVLDPGGDVHHVAGMELLGGLPHS